MEAAPRFELGMEVLQTSALPLGYAAKKNHIKPGRSQNHALKGKAILFCL
jgi:hypothetical protein